MFTDVYNPFRIFFRKLDVGEKVKVYICKISSELIMVEDGCFVYWMFIIHIPSSLNRLEIFNNNTSFFISKLVCYLKYKASTYSVHGAPTRLRGQMGTKAQPCSLLPSHLPWKAGVSAGRRKMFFLNISLRSHFVIHDEKSSFKNLHKDD